MTGWAAYKEKHPDRVRASIKAWNKSRYRTLRQFVLDYLSIHPCVDCGEEDPIVLEFDHIKGKKLERIANLCRRGLSLDRLKLEVAKCEVRCANCHRKRHAKENNYFRFAAKC